MENRSGEERVHKTARPVGSMTSSQHQEREDLQELFKQLLDPTSCCTQDRPAPLCGSRCRCAEAHAACDWEK